MNSNKGHKCYYKGKFEKMDDEIKGQKTQLTQLRNGLDNATSTTTEPSNITSQCYEVISEIGKLLGTRDMLRGDLYAKSVLEDVKGLNHRYEMLLLQYNGLKSKLDNVKDDLVCETHESSADGFNPVSEDCYDTICKIGELLGVPMMADGDMYVEKVFCAVKKLKTEAIIDVSNEPIKVADKLIDYFAKPSEWLLHSSSCFADEKYIKMAISELRQIAEHLLIYCNAHKGD